MHTLFVRGAALALLAGGLFVPASALADSNAGASTGAVVGAVTCGPAEDAPAANIVVSAPGTSLKALTDNTGRFELSGLPAGQTFTINAIADPQGSVITSRYNVSVQSGQTVDIGSLDLSICGQPTQLTTTQDGQAVGQADSLQSNADFSQGS
jgi:hypothetical protein